MSNLHAFNPPERRVGSGDGVPPDMNERLGKLEGQIHGPQHAHNMTLGGLALVAALLAIAVGAVVGFGIYELQRIDQTGDRIDKLSEQVIQLPAKISSDLRDLTRTLSESITAAKQAPTQVIMVPAPMPPPMPPNRQKQ